MKLDLVTSCMNMEINKLVVKRHNQFLLSPSLYKHGTTDSILLY